MNQYINPLIHILVISKYLQFDDDLVANPSTHDTLERYLYPNYNTKYYILMLLNILWTMKSFKIWYVIKIYLVCQFCCEVSENKGIRGRVADNNNNNIY